MKRLLALCCLAMPLFGQALVGLPQHGVTLIGSPENPVIVNNSGKTVIGYDVRFVEANGREAGINQVMALSGMPAGIPDGRSVYAMGASPVAPVNPIFPTPTGARSAAQGPIVRAALRSVIFADGQFVGTEERGSFEQFAKKLALITDVGILAKMQAWDQVEAFAQIPPTPPPSGEDLLLYLFRPPAAKRLVDERKSKGDAAAAQLAEIYSSLPSLRK